MDLRVMVFNIEEGGEGVDFARVIEAIRLADPDIVALQEAMTNTGRIAAALGWDFASARSQVISRYPIVEPGEAGGVYVLVEVQPGRCVAIASVHPPAEPYGPDLLWRGGSPEDVSELERRIRLPKLDGPLRALPVLAAAGIPGVLLGDFNAPSHLDWTKETVGLRRHLRTVVDWPVSRAVEAAGFRDAWREIHPDPVREPGLTWWARRPPTGGYEPGPDTPNDRIDLVYVTGPAITTDCQLLGEVGAPDVALGVEPWPSDHRAVVVSLELSPGPMPVFVAVERRLVAAGEAVEVRWSRPGGPGERLQMEPDGSAIPLGAGSTPTTGSARLATDGLPLGDRALVLRGGDGTALAQARFHVHAAGAPVELQTDRTDYTVGEPIGVEWALGPGNRWDWIAVFREPADDLREAHLVWRHTAARTHGSLRLDGDAAIVDQSPVGGVWPLPPGDYVAAYLLDDGPTAVARARFRIVP